ncbi:NAD(P)/FAD-dependent oxidoreductase [Arthrobacter sp. CAU 1506]|uniref:NAD(P)/FAD-dependent oxidoreductase n=1 Tax=Arthrobacter sp. CAU 1506 TaxID=2560052 RepID=UPI0010AD3532|nr:NAD(P)/FAD-dependent oxidoreductase [Arthrobacter sp. CAU 1506]TJY66397.1 NAD(P)/FAD-dependent oxidoreductase [Arthrobacter sp. CAU 1506]
MENNEWDVIIIGGGAAGLSAALMLGRALRKVLVLDGGSPRNRFASHMHGVLGNEGADPLEFLSRARAEVAGYGVEVRSAVVNQVSETAAGIAVETDDGGRLTARRLIASSGVRDDLPEIPGMAQRWGRDVLHCPYCHGWEVRGKRLAVLATSPMGIHQAQLIPQWSPDVVFFTALAGPVDGDIAAQLAARNVSRDPRPVTELVVSDDALTGIRVEGGEVVDVDAVFTAATLIPQDGYLAGFELEREDSAFGSFLKVDPTGRTSHPRIWAAGNITSPGANVPISIAAGAMAGGMINADLVTEDFALAAASAESLPGASDESSPADSALASAVSAETSTAAGATTSAAAGEERAS